MAVPDQPRKIDSLKSFERAIDVLSLFALNKPELSLAEIVSLTALPKSTAFRILNSLVLSRICDKDPITGRYSLGIALLHFADIRKRQAKVRDVAVPFLRLLRTHLDETVVLAVRAGDDRVQLDRVEAHHPLFLNADLGLRVPLYLGATGLILLSGLTPPQINGYIGRTQFERRQRNTIASAEQLQREIALVRKNGFAESRSELRDTPCMALAVPILDHKGETVAALGALIADSRFTAQVRRRGVQFLLEAAQKISTRLAK